MTFVRSCPLVLVAEFVAPKASSNGSPQNKKSCKKYQKPFCEGPLLCLIPRKHSQGVPPSLETVPKGFRGAFYTFSEMRVSISVSRSAKLVPKFQGRGKLRQIPYPVL